MKGFFKTVLILAGILLVILVPLIGIPYLIIVLLKLVFKIGKFLLILAIGFFILCVIIGLIVG